MGKKLYDFKKIHFIGIKGVAVSGLAVICRQKGHEVMGSDIEKEFITDKVLEEEGISVFKGFNPSHLDWNPDLVVVGASWDDENPEVKTAKERNLTVIMESDLRGALSQEKVTIAVTGVHGKSTTTSLLSYIFTYAGLKPSYLVGTAFIPDLGVNGHWDEGKHFIVEGDEYMRSKTDGMPKFLDLHPDTTIITTLEWEHVDMYASVEDMEVVFAKLIKNTKSKVVACRDWKSIQNIIEDFGDKVITYGIGADAQWQIATYEQKLHVSNFSVKRKHKHFDEFELNLMGRFNALNALACTIVALHYGIEIDVIKEALRTFSGLERRMNISHVKEITFIDDYGHHPTEVYETLHAIRNTYSKRNIICVFQPHMASRTMAFFEKFSQCFKDVDTIVLMDIFTSEREKNLTLKTEDLFDEIKKYHTDVRYFGNIEDTARGVRKIIGPRDVVVTMGAGDVYKIKKLMFGE